MGIIYKVVKWCIKTLNISCLVIALIIIISWLLNANQIPDFISDFLSWNK